MTNIDITGGGVLAASLVLLWIVPRWCGFIDARQGTGFRGVYRQGPSGQTGPMRRSSRFRRVRTLASVVMVQPM
ncbi:hypothetical protein SAMN04488071_1996 [Kordiimonas lacus]|uniref:Uncharacterized protein n=1 Tax=Kordiimonas lacus TaxID=637679 RepID=A0A1G6ZX02_9PROT|nr:hypothetical protein SAMN04488071_1996 [Kordiimonas lacus]